MNRVETLFMLCKIVQMRYIKNEHYYYYYMLLLTLETFHSVKSYVAVQGATTGSEAKISS